MKKQRTWQSLFESDRKMRYLQANIKCDLEEMDDAVEEMAQFDNKDTAWREDARRQNRLHMAIYALDQKDFKTAKQFFMEIIAADRAQLELVMDTIFYYYTSPLDEL
jgi:hypothetical protein